MNRLRYIPMTIWKCLPEKIIEEGRESGTKNNLAFYKTDKGGYILVTFMDNTVINESAATLLRYTLIFGGFAMVVFFPVFCIYCTKNRASAGSELSKAETVYFRCGA